MSARVIRMRPRIWSHINGGWVWCCPWHNEEGWSPTWPGALGEVGRHLALSHPERAA